MIHSHIQPKTVMAPLVLLMALMLVSCGSYQQASYYDNDGIYTEGTERVTVNRTPEQRPPARVRDNDGIYGDYFGRKAEEIDEIMEDEVFTDVDSYYSDDDQEGQDGVEQDTYFDSNNNYEGYAGWGDNATSVNINIYDGMGYGFYDYGWAYPWLYSGYYGYGWGFNNPWRYNYYSPWWGGNFGWGYAGYYGYGWGGFYGNGWGGFYNSYYCPPYFYSNRIYSNSNYAYNRSRRGYYDRNTLASNSLRGRSNLGTRSGGEANRYRTNSGRSNISNRNGVSNRSSVSSRNGLASRNSGTYRSGTTARRSVSADAIARNRAYRSSRSTRSVPNYSSNSRSGQTYRGTVPRSSTYSRGNSSAVRSGNGAYRTSTPRSSGNYRSSGSSSSPRSSGYRSSGSTSRSSGGSYRSSGSSSSRSSGGSYRSSGSSSSRSSSGSVRSSGGSSRSSGSVRSSGGSSRSSGGRSGRSN